MKFEELCELKLSINNIDASAYGIFAHISQSSNKGSGQSAYLHRLAIALAACIFKVSM